MNQSSVCCMCGTNTQDVVNLGEMKTLNNLSVHYYCLLLASTVAQNGQDHEGILGFLYKDILDELNRCKFRTCQYCSKRGASVFCSGKGCKAVFHLPCGLNNGSGHQFHGAFQSTCHVHRVKQKYIIPTTSKSCPICYDVINFKNWMKILWAPCCKKNAYFHKECLQRMALSAGYFFKCPVCNDKSKFQRTMKCYGVFIPDRDASWETEPNAFQELYYRHNECNALNCGCAKGRQYSDGGQWSIVLCNACGSQGSHVACLNQKNKHSWTCQDCVIQPDANKQTNGNTSSHTQPSTSSNTTSQPSCSKTLDDSISKRPKYVTNGNSEDNDTEIINIEDSEDEDDVVVVESIEPAVEEPRLKCLIAQDGSVIPVRLIGKREEIEKAPVWKSQETLSLKLNSSQPTTKRPQNGETNSSVNDLGFKITNVRSLSSTTIATNENSFTLNKETKTCIQAGKDFIVLKNGDNQTTIKCQSKNSDDMFTMKKALYSAMCSSFKLIRNTNTPNNALENIFGITVKEESVEKKDMSYDSSSESDVMIID